MAKTWANYMWPVVFIGTVANIGKKGLFWMKLPKWKDCYTLIQKDSILYANKNICPKWNILFKGRFIRNLVQLVCIFCLAKLHVGM
jgi:hypothetical protein